MKSNTVNTPSDTLVQIARVCHDANRAYCDSIGDFSQLPWGLAEVWQRNSAISGVAFHLGLLVAGTDPKPSASHENWMREKLADGWQYGPVKDTVAKTHPCIVPFDGLPKEQQFKDVLFAGIVRMFYEAQIAPQFNGVPDTVLDNMVQGEGNHWWVNEVVNGEKYVGRPATDNEIFAYRTRESERAQAAKQVEAEESELPAADGAVLDEVTVPPAE
jgi:hypothetical protein